MALTGKAVAATRKRILLLTPRWPYPPTGGDRLRILKLAEAVSQRHDITLLSLCQDRTELDSPLPPGGVFKEVHRLRLPRWRSWAQVALALAGSTPLQVAYYCSGAFRREVERLLPGHDMVWCHLARMAPYACRAAVPRWLEMTDAVSLTMERAARLKRSGLDPRRLAFDLESRRMRRMEQRLADEFDLISLISNVDRDTALGYETAPRANVLVAANGVEMPAVHGRPAGQRPPAIAMVGRMDSFANRDALWHFVNEILPGVVRRVPDARLHIIGHVNASDERRLRRVAAVRVEGVLPDMGTVLRNCRVGVCPVRIGAGIQNKLLDYMAHGLASVSSPIGLEGLRVQAGTELAVASSPSEWVESVVALLLDEGQASRLGVAGRAWVEREHRWSAALAPLVDRVDVLLSQKAPAQRI